MTWSRLEGLRFHWAVASSSKGHWELPPRGWKTLPDTTGGCWRWGRAGRGGAGRGGAGRGAHMPPIGCSCIGLALPSRMSLRAYVHMCILLPLRVWYLGPACVPIPVSLFSCNPAYSVDAGGAWSSTFEKHPLPQPGGSQGPGEHRLAWQLVFASSSACT
jgi:hypothetical protein